MKKSIQTLALASLLSVGGVAQAAVSFEVVSSGSLLGDMILSGDTVKFLPSALAAEAEANGGSALQLTTDVTVLKITSDAAITSIDYKAVGDYINLTDGSSPFEGVDADGQLNYTAGTMTGTSAITVSGIGATSSLGDLNQAWSEWGSLSFDAAAGITEIYLSIQNDLYAAATGPLELAKIQKKIVEVEVSSVPVPAAAVLFGSSLIGLISVARRRA